MNRPRVLTSLVAVITIVTRLFVAWNLRPPSAAHGPGIDQAAATQLARQFFEGAHGSGVVVTDVQTMDVLPTTDATGRPGWKVNIGGTISDALRPEAMLYPSYMWLFVDGDSGAVTIVAEG